MNKAYVVNFGYDGNGRPRNRYFPSMEAARAAADRHFRRRGVIVAIEEAFRDKKDK